MAQLMFFGENHRYELDGVELPSVTQIVRFMNYDTAAGANNAMRDAAAERGSRVHGYCADLVFGELGEVDGDCAGYVRAAERFLRDYQIQDFLAVEQPFGNLELGFAGTVDLIAYIDGHITIIDWKTGAKINRHVLAAQLTGYLALYTESDLRPDCPPEQIKLLGVQLQKTGKYRLIPVNMDPELLRACKTIHERLSER